MTNYKFKVGEGGEVVPIEGNDDLNIAFSPFKPYPRVILLLDCFEIAEIDEHLNDGNLEIFRIDATFQSLVDDLIKCCTGGGTSDEEPIQAWIATMEEALTKLKNLKLAPEKKP